MPTIEEIRTEWHGVRSAVGTLVGYIDGKVAQLQDMSEAYRKGYNDATDKAEKNADELFQKAYTKGLEDAWEAAIRYAFRMSELEAEKILGIDYCAATVLKKISAEEAIQKLKEYDESMLRVTNSNAQKFVEVFGFAPGYEILDDGREIYPSLNDEFWNAEYKEPEAEDGE